MFGKKDSAYVMAGVGSEELFVEREAMSAAGLPSADAQVAQWRDRLSKMDWVPDLGEDIKDHKPEEEDYFLHRRNF